MFVFQPLKSRTDIVNTPSNFIWLCLLITVNVFKSAKVIFVTICSRVYYINFRTSTLLCVSSNSIMFPTSGSILDCNCREINHRNEKGSFAKNLLFGLFINSFLKFQNSYPVFVLKLEKVLKFI